VTEVRPETPTAKTFRFAVDPWHAHRPGQHYVLRLTAPDGYTASRSYSVASPPGDRGAVELTVERLPEGEVSTYLHDVVVPGDALECRGPIGGWFVWDGDVPALLVAGGSGVVPVACMLRHARWEGLETPVHLVVSVRAPADLYYSAELRADPAVTVLTTRVPSDGRPAGHLAADDLRAHLRPDAVAYVCGSNGFCDAATGILEALGQHAERIRVERFGPSG
jgi:ferredoxin-NADP reductase